MKRWRGIRIVSLLLAAVLLISEMNVTAYAGEIDLTVEEDAVFEGGDEEIAEDIYEEDSYKDEYFEDEIIEDTFTEDDFIEDDYTEDAWEEEFSEEEELVEELTEEVRDETDDALEYSKSDADEDEDVDSLDDADSLEPEEELMASFLPDIVPRLSFYIPSGSGIENDPANEEFAKTYNECKGVNNPAFTLRPAKRKGYTFAGWEIVGSFAKIASIPRNAKKNYELQARWKPITYKITYKVNATKLPVTGIKNPNKTTYTIEDTINLEDPTAPGYKFTGWYFDAQFLMSANGLKHAAENMTLYGDWEPIKYTVNYFYNGKKTSIDATTHEYKSKTDKITEKTDVSEKGYHVSAWCTDENLKKGNYKPGAVVNNLCTEDGGMVALYAKLAPNTYTVKYDGNGADKGKVADTKATHGKSVKTAKNSYVKYGYVFEGWDIEKNPTATGPTLISYTKPGAKVENLDATIDYENGGTVTYYAQWRPANYTVKFTSSKSPKGETMDSIEATVGKNFKMPSNKFTRKDGANVDFLGWRSTTKFNGQYLEYKAGQSVSIPITATKDGTSVTFQPVWKYTLKFVDSSGSSPVNMGTETYEADKSYKLPKYTGSKDYYTYLGWSEETEGPTLGAIKVYKAGSSIKNLGNMTLITTWKPVDYTLKITEGTTKSYKISVASDEITFPSYTNQTVSGKQLTGWEIYNPSTGQWESKKKGSELSAKTLISKYADNMKTIKIRAVLNDIKFVNSKFGVIEGYPIDMNDLLTVDVSNYTDVKWKSGNSKILSNNDASKPYVFTANKIGKTKIYVTLGSKTISVNVEVKPFATFY